MQGGMAVKIGINLNAYDVIDIRQQIKLMLDNGFETTFVASENPNLAQEMEAVRSAGIICESAHAPFDKINDMWSRGEAGEVMLGRLMQSVNVCAERQIPVLVVHLSSGMPAPRISEVGYERFARLMEHAKEKGVVIAFENQRYLANLAFAFEEFPDAGFCWDVGHEEAFAGGRRYMPLFGHKLCQLHVHDNFLERDIHLIPYDGKIDFERVAASIASVDYEGSLMLELCAPASEVYRDYTPETYYKRAAEAARKLAARVEFYRQER